MKLLVSSLLAVSAAANPLYRPGKPAVYTRDDTVSVTSADIDTLAFYAQWAAAAYCNSLGTPGTAIACANATCTSLEANGATVLANLGSESSVTDLLGFVGYDPVRDQIGVSIRGSKSIRNWLEDFTFALEDCSKFVSPALAASAGDDCQMHAGFGLGWADLRDETMAAVAAAQADHPTASVVVAGHSLGAAVATIAAADIRANGTAADLFTYGSPRVGNEAFAEFLSSQGPLGAAAISISSGTGTGTGTGKVSNHRVTHLNDPVPQLPPILVLDYAHTSPEFWLTNDGVPAAVTETGFFAGKLDYTPADIQVCTGFQSRDCNAGEPSLNTTAHKAYFEPISACAPSGLTFK